MEHQGNKNKRRETGGNYHFIGRPEHIVLSLVTGDSKTVNEERQTRRARAMDRLRKGECWVFRVTPVLKKLRNPFPNKGKSCIPVAFDTGYG